MTWRRRGGRQGNTGSSGNMRTLNRVAVSFTSIRTGPNRLFEPRKDAHPGPPDPVRWTAQTGPGSWGRYRAALRRVTEEWPDFWNSAFTAGRSRWHPPCGGNRWDLARAQVDIPGRSPSSYAQNVGDRAREHGCQVPGRFPISSWASGPEAQGWHEPQHRRTDTGKSAGPIGADWSDWLDSRCKYSRPSGADLRSTAHAVQRQTRLVTGEVRASGWPSAGPSGRPEPGHHHRAERPQAESGGPAHRHVGEGLRCHRRHGDQGCTTCCVQKVASTSRENNAGADGLLRVWTTTHGTGGSPKIDIDAIGPIRMVHHFRPRPLGGHHHQHQLPVWPTPLHKAPVCAAKGISACLHSTPAASSIRSHLGPGWSSCTAVLSWIRHAAAECPVAGSNACRRFPAGQRADEARAVAGITGRLLPGSISASAQMDEPAAPHRRGATDEQASHEQTHDAYQRRVSTRLPSQSLSPHSSVETPFIGLSMGGYWLGAARLWRWFPGAVHRLPAQ